MKSILIVVYAHYVKLIIEGKKTVEVRKNKNLANAIKKLIAEQGGCWIYIYVAKSKPELYVTDDGFVLTDFELGEHYKFKCLLNGKVCCRFWCDKVEDIIHYNKENYFTEYSGSKVYGGWKDNHKELYNKSCLTLKDFIDYVGNKPAYAIHISKLELFDKPRELSEFRLFESKCKNCPYEESDFNCDYCDPHELTKAPSNYCYIESEK